MTEAHWFYLVISTHHYTNKIFVNIFFTSLSIVLTDTANNLRDQSFTIWYHLNHLYSGNYSFSVWWEVRLWQCSPIMTKWIFSKIVMKRERYVVSFVNGVCNNTTVTRAPILVPYGKTLQLLRRSGTPKWNFLHDPPWMRPWIKSISNELDITVHVIVSQLSRHCDVISRM